MTTTTQLTHPLVDQCVRENATGIFDLARQLEHRLTSMKALCDRMTDPVDSLTDEEVLDMAKRVDGNPEGMAAFIRFTIGLYHKEKSNAAAWRLMFEREAAKTLIQP
jgi:hypothetical protein